MKPYVFGKALLVTLLLPAAGIAQTTTSTPTAPASDVEWFVPEVGTREFTLGGSGATNKDFDASFGGVSFSYGQYLNEALAVVLRQSVNYSNPDVGGTQWNGSTKIAIDHHFAARGRVRPFVGANFGRIYGDAVRDTWAAGLEAGAKFYVQERTFIVATAEYGWLFQHATGVNNEFDDGQWNWSLGIGFNF